MFGFGSGLIVGIILATVGVNGIVKLSDNVLNNVQDQTCLLYTSDAADE